MRLTNGVEAHYVTQTVHSYTIIILSNPKIGNDARLLAGLIGIARMMSMCCSFLHVWF